MQAGAIVGEPEEGEMRTRVPRRKEARVVSGLFKSC